MAKIKRTKGSTKHYTQDERSYNTNPRGVSSGALEG